MHIFQPGNSTERTRKFIERLRLNGKYEEYKQKKAVSEKLRRQRVKESLNKMTKSKAKKFIDTARLKCLDRVRKHREKAKQMNSLSERISCGPSKLTSSTPSSARKDQHHQRSVQSHYNTDSALAKATTKFRKGLPKSLGKQMAVIEKFFDSLDDEKRQQILFKKKTMNKGGKKGIGKELSDRITQFYERDDVSRISPNTKDARFYRNASTGEKELRQKRYMILTLQQAYDKFLIENAGEPSVSFCLIISMQRS